MSNCFALLRRMAAFCVLILLSFTAAAQFAITPSTTLSAETSNNTSASSTFRAQSNGNAGPGNVSKSPLRTLLYPGATTSNGNYSIASLPPGSYTLTANSAGRLPATATVSVTGGSQTIENFKLSTAGVLKGKVTTSSGSGVGGVKITFTGGVFNTTTTVVTDVSGNYSAGWIPVGNYVISATASGLTKTSSASISAGVVTTVNFTL